MVDIFEGEKYKIYRCFTQGTQNLKKPKIKIQKQEYIGKMIHSWGSSFIDINPWDAYNSFQNFLVILRQIGFVIS